MLLLPQIFCQTITFGIVTEPRSSVAAACARRVAPGELASDQTNLVTLLNLTVTILKIYCASIGLSTIYFLNRT